MKIDVILKYDTETGNITDANDMYCGCNLSLKALRAPDAEQTSTPIEDLVKLRNAGFTTDEIVELKRKELI